MENLNPWFDENGKPKDNRMPQFDYRAELPVYHWPPVITLDDTVFLMENKLRW